MIRRAPMTWLVTILPLLLLTAIDAYAGDITITHDTTLAGTSEGAYDIGQSFTATQTGALSAIGVAAEMNSGISGTATLNVYEGAGNTGNLLYTKSGINFAGIGTINTTSNYSFHSLAIDQTVNVTNGSVYTFVLSPGHAMDLGYIDDAGGRGYTGGDLYSYDTGGVDSTKDMAFIATIAEAPNSLPSFDLPDTDPGRIVTDVGNGINRGYGAEVQSDGKILVAGYTDTDTGSDVALTRHHPNGAPDTGFGDNGVAVIQFSLNNDRAYKVLQLGTGKLAIAGNFVDDVGQSNVLVARLNIDGSLDTGFGGGTGFAVIDASPGQDIPWSIAEDSSGRIIVPSYTGSNFTTIRLTANGELDASFGENGMVISSVEGAYSQGAYSVAVDKNDRTLVAGQQQSYNGTFIYELVVFRYLDDGSLDTSFGDMGMAIAPINAGSSYVDIEVDSNGNIVVGAQAGANVVAARWNEHGTLDTSFGIDGVATVNLSWSTLKGMVLQADDAILVSGSRSNDNIDYAVARFGVDGVLDTSFGSGGQTSVDIGGEHNYAWGMALQADGRAIVAGNSYKGAENHFAFARFLEDGTVDTSLGGDTLDATPTYIEDADPVILDADVAVNDAEEAAKGHYNGARLTITRSGGAHSDDQFSFSEDASLFTLSGNELQVSGQMFATYSTTGGMLTLEFSGSGADATGDRVIDALRHIRYSNSNDTPPASIETLWTFTVADGGSVSDTLTVTITATNDAPSISGTPTTNVDEDSPYSFTLAAADPEGDAVTFSIQNKPSWASFNASTGALTGTPTNDDVGTTGSIAISVTDGSASASLPAFDLEVANINDAPTIGGSPDQTVAQGNSYTFTPTASDIDVGDTLIFGISNKPYWATFDTSTGTLSGNPNNDDIGTTSTIVISVSDGTVGTSLPAFDLTVSNVNDAPIIGGTPATSVDEDSAYHFTPTASDIDVGDTLTFAIGNKPAWASFDTSTGALTGTPRNEDVGTTGNIVISVTDGTVSTSLPAFDLEVVNTNDSPVISGTPATSAEVGVNYAFTPTASDVDLGDTLTFSITGQPDWAQFDTATGALSGLPEPGDEGAYPITLSVTDGTVTQSLDPFTLTVSDGQDTDGDGVIDYQENLDGTDPTDPTDYRDVTAPIVTAPDDLVLDADALTTPVTRRQLLGLPADADDTRLQSALAGLAIDNIDGSGCCAPRVEALDDDRLLLAPGRHTVTWQATDAKGNVGTDTQVVNLRPLVSLSQDQVSAEGARVEIRFILNGPSPFYPLEVPFVIDNRSTADGKDHNLSEGSVIFTNLGGSDQTEASLTLTLTDDDGLEGEESLIVRLDDRTSDSQDLANGYDPLDPDVFDINAGANTSHQIRILESNVAPSVSLTLSQAGRNTVLVTPDDGPVTVRGEVTDPNPDDRFDFDWRGTDTVLRETDGDAAGEQRVFDPTGLSPGRYQARVRVADSRGASGTDQLYFRMVDRLPTLKASNDADSDGIDDATEGTADSDRDGIPDYLDNLAATNLLPLDADRTDAYLIECDPGVHCRLGLHALLSEAGGARLSDQDILEQTDITSDTVFIPSGATVDLASQALPTPGQSVRLVIPQTQAMPKDAYYRSFRDGDWATFIEDADNALHSTTGQPGHCPPPGDERWQPGLQPGHHCLQLTLEDGGPNDADGRVNAAVAHTGSVVKPRPVSVSGGGQSGSGGTAGVLLLGLIVILAGLRRLQAKGPVDHA